MYRARLEIQKYKITTIRELQHGCKIGLVAALERINTHFKPLPVKNLSPSVKNLKMMWEAELQMKMKKTELMPRGRKRYGKVHSLKAQKSSLDKAFKIWTGRLSLDHVTDRSATVIKKILKEDKGGEREHAAVLKAALSEHRSRRESQLKLKRSRTVQENKNVLPSAILQFFREIPNIFGKWSDEEDTSPELVFAICAMFPVCLGFRTNAWNLANVNSPMFAENGQRVNVPESIVAQRAGRKNSIVTHTSSGGTEEIQGSILVYFSENEESKNSQILLIPFPPSVCLVINTLR